MITEKCNSGINIPVLATKALMLYMPTRKHSQTPTHFGTNTDTQARANTVKRMCVRGYVSACMSVCVCVWVSVCMHVHMHPCFCLFVCMYSSIGTSRQSGVQCASLWARVLQLFSK